MTRRRRARIFDLHELRFSARSNDRLRCAPADRRWRGPVPRGGHEAECDLAVQPQQSGPAWRAGRRGPGTVSLVCRTRARRGRRVCRRGGRGDARSAARPIAWRLLLVSAAMAGAPELYAQVALPGRLEGIVTAGRASHPSQIVTVSLTRLEPE